MSILLSKEQLDEIRELQKKLDDRIRKDKGLEGVDLSLEKYLALKTELFEFVNEIESFKYWKENKGKSHILEEACDTLHFIMSIAIDNDVEMDSTDMLMENHNKDNYEMNDLLGIADATISDAYIEKDWSVLNSTLTLICIALEKCGYNADDLYGAYISKNKENHNRQDSNY